LPTNDSGVDIKFTSEGLTEAERERERQKAIINLQHFSTGGGWRVTGDQNTNHSTITKSKNRFNNKLLWKNITHIDNIQMSKMISIKKSITNLLID